MRQGAFSMALGAIAVQAFAGSININFCECGADLPVEALALYAPLLAAALSPDADLNGQSTMEVSPPFKCEVGGNAIPDCSCELGLVSELLRNQAVDLTAYGGVSHQMVFDTYRHNYSVLSGYMDGWDYQFFLEFFNPLLALIYGYLVIGDGTFEEVAPGQFAFCGSGGYALSLIYVLPVTDNPISPQAFNLANYGRLPQYLAASGDADADGFTNAEEYGASSSNADFIAGALDRSRCGSQYLGEGEGEGEGQEGEGEGETEGEGEGEAADQPVPAMTGFAAAVLILALVASGFCLGIVRKTQC